MTAVASPPAFTQHNRPAWAINGGGHPVNPDELNRMFVPRKNLQRNNSSSSIASTSSNSSTSTVISGNSNSNPQSNGAPMPSNDMNSWPGSAGAGAANGAAGTIPAAAGARKRPQPKTPWGARKPDGQLDFAQPGMAGRPSQVANGLHGSVNSIHSPSPILPSQAQMAAQQSMSRGNMAESLPAGQPVLYLLSQNGTFERKTISVPFSPDTLRIGRQTNVKTVPTPVNGYFDSKVLSRQHAEIWADRQGKIWIRDVKSSNGTFVNGTRLSQENRESEPHELQTGDHLELGIDIVSEDQKTIVHHKVAAKVEHAGFLNPSSSLLDMNFGDLDPTNGGAMMMQAQGGVPLRGARNGNQAAMAGGGRMVPSAGMMGTQANAMNSQRGFFFSPISTEQIVKRLQSEMRTARLQSQDLGRTGQFISALLSKDDIKDIEKPEPTEQPKPHMVNGNGLSFRTDSKTRFSDPPAPPPQQPLPEKPDVPSLKRGMTERPKIHTQNGSPVRQDGTNSQIIQLTEALNNARREIEMQTSRMRDLEEKLQKECQARQLAEELARRLEENASKLNGSPIKPESEANALEEAFEPPVEPTKAAEDNAPTSNIGTSLPAQPEAVGASATQLHAQIESMVLEIKDLRHQLEAFKQRAETAEAERDADRNSLAEMALQIRKDAEAREAAVRQKAAQSPIDTHAGHNDHSETSDRSSTMIKTPSTGSSRSNTTPGEPADPPTLSRANTITPLTASAGGLTHNQALANSVPYASMIGVVMIGIAVDHPHTAPTAPPTSTCTARVPRRVRDGPDESAQQAAPERIRGPVRSTRGTSPTTTTGCGSPVPPPSGAPASPPASPSLRACRRKRIHSRPGIIPVSVPVLRHAQPSRGSAGVGARRERVAHPEGPDPGPVDAAAVVVHGSGTG
ncbi:hypothetical protein DL767_001578 [Monosporascus sp. MG133]|nr:hypothetical protein DL767_001578 [Monosporascus sp. MG133]